MYDSLYNNESKCWSFISFVEGILEYISVLHYGDRHMAKFLGITSATVYSINKTGIFLRSVFSLKQVRPPASEELACLLAQ